MTGNFKFSLDQTEFMAMQTDILQIRLSVKARMVYVVS
jgi:hypothetical protein